jgi:hypothetical protein
MKLAKRYFNSSVKTEDDYRNINIALRNYLASDRVKKGFIKNGSTWFNNWKDWINVNTGKSDVSSKYGRIVS